MKSDMKSFKDKIGKFILMIQGKVIRSWFKLIDIFTIILN